MHRQTSLHKAQNPTAELFQNGRGMMPRGAAISTDLLETRVVERINLGLVSVHRVTPAQQHKESDTIKKASTGM